MKEYLFIIWDINSDATKFVKITATDLNEAKNKFVKAFCPFVEFSYTDVEYMLENQDIRIYCSEYNEIINL